MKIRMSSMAIACISLITIGLVFSGQSFAKIDLANVTGLWLFDEGSGTVAKDSSGNGLDGTFTGTPQWVKGKFGTALEFDGASYVTIPDHKNATDGLTLTAWVKSSTETWNDYGWILEKRDIYIIHPNQNTTNIAFCISNGGPWNLPNSWDTGAVGPEVITEWHLYTCTFDSATGKWNIYIDGEVASSLDLNKDKLVEGTGPAHIGFDNCCGGTRFGKGTVDEVGVFGVALEQDDIRNIMNSGLKPAVLTAVNSASKLSTTWADIKTQN